MLYPVRHSNGHAEADPRFAPQGKTRVPRRMRQRRARSQNLAPASFGPPIHYVKIPAGAEGTEATLKVMKKLVFSPWGHRHPDVVQLARMIREGAKSKDYRAEAQAIFDFAHIGAEANLVYRLDPSGLEWVQTPYHTLMVAGEGDCFVQGTKVLLREGHKIVPVETLREGDEIWGKDRWSRVTRVWGDKGVLPTWQILLNNGSAMRLTPGHKVWVARCETHPDSHRRPKSRPCSCRMDKREVLRVEVRDLEPGMVVVQPSEVGYGQGEMDPDRAYIEGLYLSEGWTEEKRFAISGKDGHPKESQKVEVEEICTRLGISTYMHRRYVRVSDPEWTQRLKAMGAKAPQKHALSLNLIKESADELLRGIMADSGKNTNGGGRTFTSTSYDLWLQARVLLKMKGETCSSRHVVDHGGLGKNPIWRLGIRDSSRTDAKMKLLRVKEVIRDEAELPCFDIETDDHYVWLPEADWSVSQCDDHATAICALAAASGFQCGFRTVKGDSQRTDQWSHVYAVIGIPVKGGKTEWLSADSTQAEAFLGWDPPEGKSWGMKTWVLAPDMEDIEWDT